MGRLTVLMYHSISAHQSRGDRRYACPPREFRAHLRHLQGIGYRFCGLPEVMAYVARERELEEDAIFLTFDDGYRDNLESACPVLEETGVPACVFVATGFMGRSNEWSGPELARRPMLGWEDIVALNARGVSVGGHSVSHARLPDLPPARVWEEVEGCKRELEQRLGISVDAFAYPYGLSSPAVCDAVRGAGYRAAFSTRPGFNRPGDDALLLRRIEVEGHDSCRTLARKVRFGSNDGRPRVALRYYTDRIRARLGRVA